MTVCGICGIWNHDGRPVEPKALASATKALYHRGPDDAGYLFLNSRTGEHSLSGPEICHPPAGADLALGHRRLSIIDLSPAGRQPMTNEDATVWLTFNGEIYNFLALRDRLLALGHAFKSRTDTETIIHLYEEMGEEFLTEIQGMFALALWDGRLKRLILARDRAGKKPLWLAQGKNFIAFASELKSLTAANLAQKEMDYKSLDRYLAYGYVPSPDAIYKGVRKLRPAEGLVIGQDGAVTQRRYWQLKYEPKQGLSLAEAKDSLREILQQAVARRLVSDVPLGAFLSGGTDSSVVVALMSQAAAGAVRTFSVGFGEPGFDELAYARAVARHCQTQHMEIMVRPDLVKALPTLVWLYGEPYADSSALPTFYLARATRRHVTVALNGDGGDESFLGYRRFAGLRLAARLKSLPRPLLAAGRELCKLLSGIKAHDRSAFEYGYRLFRGLTGGGSLLETYISWIGIFSPAQRAALYTPEMAAQVGELETGGYLANVLDNLAVPDLAERFAALDVSSYLPEDLLVKMDMATMAHALEARSPLLDTAVMEWAATLSPELKLKGGVHKRVLKELARELLPAEVVDRPKMGFGLPVGRWFKGPLKGWLKYWLLDGPLTAEGWMQKAALARLWEEHLSGRADHTHRLWALIFLAQWMELVLKGPDRPPAEALELMPALARAPSA